MNTDRHLVARIVVAALALCALSFFVGVAGDLSLASQPGPAATVEIPANEASSGKS
ncbi:MAG: hypothetical protein AB7P07_01770 [Hyphomonadaceae bacterium]